MQKRGFILDDFAAGRAAALATIRGWVEEGVLETVVHVLNGPTRRPRH